VRSRLERVDPSIYLHLLLSILIQLDGSDSVTEEQEETRGNV
jgi:hypothetical protein